jgi:hypothetical protein
MKTLTLEDLKDMDRKALLGHIVEQYECKPEEVKKFDILIAYESVGNYGCDSSSWFLLRDRASKALYEVSGSHCSCYGFENQWGPSLTTLAYLKSDHFRLYTGGYDDGAKANEEAVKNFIKRLRK